MPGSGGSSAELGEVLVGDVTSSSSVPDVSGSVVWVCPVSSVSPSCRKEVTLR